MPGKLSSDNRVIPHYISADERKNTRVRLKNPMDSPLCEGPDERDEVNRGANPIFEKSEFSKQTLYLFEINESHSVIYGGVKIMVIRIGCGPVKVGS